MAHRREDFLLPQERGGSDGVAAVEPHVRLRGRAPQQVKHLWPGAGLLLIASSGGQVQDYF